MSCFPTEAALALDSKVVLADWPSRARVRVTGPDRSKLLHNLTTNAVNGRESGSGCEAFVTSPQGKTLGFVTLLILDDAIWLRTEAEGLPPILPHLQKYGVLEEVELVEVTDLTFELHLTGPLAAELLGDVGGCRLPGVELEHLPAQVAGKAVRIVRESPLGPPGFTVIGERQEAEAVRSALLEAGRSLGLVRLSPEAFDAFRIEAGTPASGRDVTEKNLPQELARDSRAISFTKGCYLGQETVARLDALGHVNRLFRGFLLEADSTAALPAPGSILVAGQKEIGWITSSGRSERSGRGIALGFVRTSHVAPGSTLDVRDESGETIPAVVVALPITGSNAAEAEEQTNA